MKTYLRNVLFVFSALMVFSNCAKRGNPSGGLRDTIPPVIVKSTPENFSTNFSGDEIRIVFDEYIKLKELQENLIISPPMEYQPLITPFSTSKTLKIKILDTLKENTTYSFSFGRSIVDNNEENPLEYFKYVLSTGEFIDSLNLKGRVADALLPEIDGNLTLALYEMNEEYNDSVIFNEKPTYVTTTRDTTQTFEFTNLKEGSFLLLALKETITNYTFEPKTDKIAYHDGQISLPTDSIYDLLLFKEIPDYVLARPSHETRQHIIFGFEGEAEELSLSPITELPSEFNSRIVKDRLTDTLHYWFKPPLDVEVYDTLNFLAVNGAVRDTALVRMRDLFPDSLEISMINSRTITPRDTMVLSGNIPLVSVDQSLLKVIDKDSVTLDASLVLDSIINTVQVVFPIEDEQSYNVELLPGSITDYYEATNDTLQYRLRSQAVSDYGTIGVTLQNVDEFPMIVELIDQRYEVVARDILEEQKQVYFDYLLPGSYYLRIIYDDNANGKWDTGHFLKRLQPEKVSYYPEILEVRANWSLNETFILD